MELFLFKLYNMKIFKIINDSNNIQAIQPTKKIGSVLDFLKFDCKSRINDWKEIEFYVYNPKIKAKNFYNMGSGNLIFDEKTLDICRTVFEMSGEILPVRVERGSTLYLLNILDCKNGLDYENTVWDFYNDGTKGRILKYAMHEERVINESTMFKIPETSKTDIFCFAETKDRKDEFYCLYHDNNLTGLIFDKI